MAVVCIPVWPMWGMLVLSPLTDWRVTGGIPLDCTIREGFSEEVVLTGGDKLKLARSSVGLTIAL